MSNALLLFAQGLDETALQRAVPPPIRPKQIEPLAWNGDVFSFDLSPAALEGALEILPCLSVVHGGEWGYQFAIECETKAGHSMPGRPRPDRLVCRGRAVRLQNWSRIRYGKRSGR